MRVQERGRASLFHPPSRLPALQGRESSREEFSRVEQAKSRGAKPRGATGDAVLGARIRQLRKAAGLRIHELGISKSLASQYESGTTMPPLRSLRLIAERLNTTVDALFRTPEAIQPDMLREVEERENFYHLPLNQRQIAGGPGIDNPLNRVNGSIAFRKDYIDGEGLDIKSLETWFVEGDSMAPVLVHGDLVVVNAGLRKIINGEIYAFYDAKGGSRVKYIHEQRDGGLILVSANSSFPQEIIPASHRDDIEICGIVELRSGRVRKSR